MNSSPNPAESEELYSIDIQSTGKLFATGGQMGVIRIYDLASGQFLTDCRAHSSSVMSIKFSPDGKQIVSTGMDGLVAIWNVFL